MIDVVKNLDNFLKRRDEISPKNSIGLVPTMGNLHRGHFSLLENSLKEQDVTILTIFVNPKQFGPNEDFSKYPRTLEQDVEGVKAIHQKVAPRKELLIFAPGSNEEIYPSDYKTHIQVKDLSDILCGANRPGHFEGVCTVVYRLFAFTKPTMAYFGSKDYQQFKIIERMRDDLLLTVKLKALPIIRDGDGLALSSRNRYLSSEERDKALVLPQSLNKIHNTLKNQGVVQANKEISHILAQKDYNWDYLEIRDADSLGPLTEDSERAIVAGALKVGGTRLIDNQRVELKNAR